MFGLSFSWRPSFTSAFKYRDRAAIMADILKTIKTAGEGESAYGIMLGARLNYLQTKKYVNYMLNAGLIVCSARETYLITAKGSSFLQFVEIQRMQVFR